jgi:hypothetical protein
MAKDGGMNIVLLGGLAVGGYFLYQYLSGGSLPADAGYIGPLPIGSTVQVPSSFASLNPGVAPTGPAITQAGYLYFSPANKLFYASYTAPTAAQQSAGQTAMAAISATNATNVPVTTQTSSGPVTSPTATVAPPTGTATTAAAVQSLDSVYTQLKTLAGSDPNFTGSGDSLSSSPDHWNVYVNQLLPGASLNLDTLFGGPNRFSPVTAAQFWALAGPVLGRQFGLSGYRGMGLYAGLGAYMQDRGVFPFGWA